MNFHSYVSYQRVCTHHFGDWMRMRWITYGMYNGGSKDLRHQKWGPRQQNLGIFPRPVWDSCMIDLVGTFDTGKGGSPLLVGSCPTCAVFDDPQKFLNEKSLKRDRTVVYA